PGAASWTGAPRRPWRLWWNARLRSASRGAPPPAERTQTRSLRTPSRARERNAVHGPQRRKLSRLALSHSRRVFARRVPRARAGRISLATGGSLSESRTMEPGADPGRDGARGFPRRTRDARRRGRPDERRWIS